MLIREKMLQTKLSSTQGDIMEYILSHPDEVSGINLKELAAKTYTSSATVLRLVNKLGFHSYVDFQNAFEDETEYLNHHFRNIDANKPFSKGDSPMRIAGRMTALARESAEDTLSLLEAESLVRAVDILLGADTIWMYAISYPVCLAQMFRMNMMRIGKSVQIETISGEEYFSQSLVRSGDCAVFLSYSGEVEKLVNIQRRCRLKGIPTIVISSIGENSLKAYADVCLSMTTREKLYSKIGGFSSEYSIKLLLDILYGCCFAEDYDENQKKRIAISKASEKGRFSDMEILKE